MSNAAIDENKALLLEEASRMVEDFPYYAYKNLKIALKDADGEAAGLAPFKLNKAQLYIHERLEEQLFEHGHVRALILKGRQQGCSTLIGGRYYWKTQFRHGIKTFILTHLAEATDNLFSMVKRYHDHLPPWIRPTISKNNTRQLRFPKLDSEYKVSTAGTKGTGRSGTYHYFHGSEVAFWPKADDHAGGILQGVGRNNGTEVVFESTANGIGGYFHKQWQMASKGLGDFQAIFVPWFWQDEYSQEPPANWVPTGEEQKRQDMYKLDMAQTYWMHLKNIELGGQPGLICNLFMQEYPCNAVEAFTTSGDDTICKPEYVAKARTNTVDDPYGARVMGVDPARMGKDRTSMIDRKGRKSFNLKSYSKKKITEVAQLVAARIERAKQPDDEWGPYQAVFVDVGGLGSGVVDVLHDMGYDDIVVPVNFGGTPTDDERYVNKRVEMWDTMGQWTELEAGVEIPDEDSLHADMIAPQYTHNLVRNQKVLESKEQMVKRGVDSPDEGDALALTFAFPVAAPEGKANRRNRRKKADWRTA